MKIQRILIGGLAVMAFDMVFGIITCGWLFNWVYKLEPANIWRPMAKGPGIEYYAVMLLLSVIFAIVYALLHKGIPGKNKYIKGIVFGLCAYAIGMLPGMFATYTFMTVNPGVTIYWSIVGLVQIPVDGLIVAAIYGE